MATLNEEFLFRSLNSSPIKPVHFRAIALMWEVNVRVSKSVQYDYQVLDRGSPFDSIVCNDYFVAYLKTFVLLTVFAFFDIYFHFPPVEVLKVRFEIENLEVFLTSGFVCLIQLHLDEPEKFCWRCSCILFRSPLCQTVLTLSLYSLVQTSMLSFIKFLNNMINQAYQLICSRVVLPKLKLLIN